MSESLVELAAPALPQALAKLCYETLLKDAPAACAAAEVRLWSGRRRRLLYVPGLLQRASTCAAPGLAVQGAS